MTNETIQSEHYPQWISLLTLQAAANDTLAGPGWRSDPHQFDYLSAIDDELTEARLAASYAPFWSGGEKPAFDLSNLKLELVDTLHFLMSSALQDILPVFGLEVSIKKVAADASAAFSGVQNEPELEFYHGLLHATKGHALLLQHQGAWFDFARTCRSLHFSFNELYGRYVAKNALNVFRKEIGYKQDKSVKYWINPTPVFFRGKVETVADLDAILKDEGDYAAVESEGGERYVKCRGGHVVKYSEASRIEDNFFVMRMVDEAAAAGEDLLSVTFDDMVAKIRAKHAEVTKADQFPGVLD